MWSWLGIAALGWCVFSFAFAMVVGRVIRVGDQTLKEPDEVPVPVRPKRRSGFRVTQEGAADAEGQDGPSPTGTWSS